MSAIALVEKILAEAHARGASDVHLDPHAGRIVVRMRVDGILHDVSEIHAGMRAEVLARIKILAGLRTDEQFAAQDGRFRFASSAMEGIDVRVSTAPTYHGENAVLRLLTPLVEHSALETLGFSFGHANAIEAALTRPHGMILVTGPTGSGKTSTLYTLITLLNKREVNIITIEDPVEYSIEGVNQIQVNARSGLTFETGLRSMLRQDPDIIMVGEIRDSVTAGLACNSALTGHLILSTLHTNDAVSALPRLLDLGIEPYLLASTVSLVIAQRLVRKVCTDCINMGCEHCCGTGYRGRICVAEVLGMTPVLREAMLRKASIDELRSLAISSGMIPMLEDGDTKARMGITSSEEVLRLRYE